MASLATILIPLHRLILAAAEDGQPLTLTADEVQQYAADIERDQSRAWLASIAPGARREVGL